MVIFFLKFLDINHFLKREAVVREQRTVAQKATGLVVCCPYRDYKW